MIKSIQGNIVDIHSRSVFSGEIQMEGGLISSIEKTDQQYSRFILPGFVDSHIHIESSLLIPENFAKVALSHGTVATVSDPHEIANVCGLDGVQFMINSGDKSPLKFSWCAPSCVPATSFETSGAIIEADDLDVLFRQPKVVALGEMMNYPGVINADEAVLSKCRTAQKHSKVIDGHAPALVGSGLKEYIKAGISTDHECITLDEAIEKIADGMLILIREGSSAKNFEALYPLLNSHPNKVMLCSDDLHAHDLLNGHINLLLRRALSKGVPLFNVLDTVSKNPVLHYKLPVGLLRTGDPADFIIVDNLEDFNILETWIDGEQVYNSLNLPQGSHSSDIINVFNADIVSRQELEVSPESSKVRVMEVEEGSIYTKSNILSVKGDFNTFLDSNNILKLYVKDRYKNGPVSKALVTGFGTMKGALASTIAHDSHNIIAVGSSYEDIERAINLLIQKKGGISYVYLNSGIEEILPLPVAGLMSNLSAQEVSIRYEKISKLIKEHGCVLSSPFMTLSFLALLVIPSLKLSDKGLFDVETFSFTDLFVQ